MFAYMCVCMYNHLCASCLEPEENVRFPEAEFKMVQHALNQPLVLSKINMCP